MSEEALRAAVRELTTPPKVRKKKRQLTPREKEQAVALWAAGESTLEALAKKFDVTVRSLQHLFELRGVKKGELAEKIQAEAKAEVDRLVREQAATLAGQAFATKEEIHKLIRYATKKIGMLLIQAEKDSKNAATCRADIQTLREAINAWKTAQEAQFPLLGIREDDRAGEVMPELHIVERSDEQIRAEHANKAGDLGDISGQKIDLNAELDKELSK